MIGVAPALAGWPIATGSTLSLASWIFQSSAWSRAARLRSRPTRVSLTGATPVSLAVTALGRPSALVVVAKLPWALSSAWSMLSVPWPPAQPLGQPAGFEGPSSVASTRKTRLSKPNGASSIPGAGGAGKPGAGGAGTSPGAAAGLAAGGAGPWRGTLASS